MTTNHEHTPTTEVIRETYIGEPPYTLYGYTEEEFDRWHATIEAAAEQRGAIKALREAADEFAPEWPDKPDLSATRGVSQTRKWLHNRADLLEGDDE